MIIVKKHKRDLFTFVNMSGSNVAFSGTIFQYNYVYKYMYIKIFIYIIVLKYCPTEYYMKTGHIHSGPEYVQFLYSAQWDSISIQHIVFYFYVHIFIHNIH
jgi:hypothetical protein